ncbi:Immune-associated nucleotide-binding protein 10 [Bulinus truncatus]|nr:Immune-associated nucleotide-binding protein 10 [Bulinus truncatus]
MANYSSTVNRSNERMAGFDEAISAFKKQEKKIINLLLLGKAGTGKSFTGNILLKRKEFITSDNNGFAPPTCECYENDDMLLRVVDTPGLIGTRNTPDEMLEIMFNAMNLCSEGFNAFVYVLAYGDRFTQEDKEILAFFKECFGEKFTEDFCVIVFTRGDSFDINMEEQEKPSNFRDWLKQQVEPPEFKELIDECQERVVLFYNVGVRYQTEREKSRSELLQMAKEAVENLSTIMRKNGENPSYVYEFADDLHNILTITRITSKPCEEKLKRMLMSLLIKVDSMKKDQTPSIFDRILKAIKNVLSSNTFHAMIGGVVGGAVGGSLGVLIFALASINLIGLFAVTFLSVVMIAATLAGAVAGSIISFAFEKMHAFIILILETTLLSVVKAIILWTSFRYGQSYQSTVTVETVIVTCLKLS